MLATLLAIQSRDEAGQTDYHNERAALQAELKRLTVPTLVTLARSLNVQATLPTKQRAIDKICYKVFERSAAREAIAY